MLLAIREFFERMCRPAADQGDASHALRLATAALLVEVMRADHAFDPREREALLTLLQQHQQLAPEEVETLLELAEQAQREATSLFQFTDLIRDHYSYPQRVALIEAMWRIALADNRLDRYEEHLIRKVAELLYVSHRDFIGAKLHVQQRGAGSIG